MGAREGTWVQKRKPWPQAELGLPPQSGSPRRPKDPNDAISPIPAAAPSLEIGLFPSGAKQRGRCRAWEGCTKGGAGLSFP